MPGSTLSLPLARRLALPSGALVLGLLLASCNTEPVDPANPTAAAARASQGVPRPNPTSEEAEAYQAMAARRQVLVADAVDALDETYTALGLLAKRDNNGAVEALSRATGKLEVVLAAEPGLALAPVAVDVKTYDVIARPDDVDRIRELAEDALDDGRLQEGRILIRDLASERVYSVTNLPLATYPVALKQAAALIKSDRPSEGVATLEAALATQVVQETVIPLPLVRAQAMLEQARPAAEKASRSPEEASSVRALVAQARRQLALARALGYGTRSELDDLDDALDRIESKVNDRGSARGLFDRLKGLFDKARQSANESGKRSSQATGGAD